MNLLRKIRTLLTLAVMAYLLTLGFVMGFAALQPVFEPEQFENADVIVVLGAGMDPDGTLHRSSVLRVEKGVALFKSGAAERMHFTGGLAGPRSNSAGAQMGFLAISLGVPEHVTSAEGQSYSTLQNALFSEPYLRNANRIILVTEGFHLPRSWASLKYFGDFDIALARSVAFRKTSPNAKWPWLTMCLREALAIWFNAGRLAVWEAAGWLNYDTNTRNDLLY